VDKKKRVDAEHFLKTVPLFAHMSNTQRKQIADALQSTLFAPGERIVTQGEAGDKFYLITDGTVVITEDSQGNALTLTRGRCVTSLSKPLSVCLSLTLSLAQVLRRNRVGERRPAHRERHCADEGRSADAPARQIPGLAALRQVCNLCVRARACVCVSACLFVCRCVCLPALPCPCLPALPCLSACLPVCCVPACLPVCLLSLSLCASLGNMQGRPCEAQRWHRGGTDDEGFARDERVLTANSDVLSVSQRGRG
jgi:hypothetical protein